MGVWVGAPKQPGVGHVLRRQGLRRSLVLRTVDQIDPPAEDLPDESHGTSEDSG